jgi:hypothetical protein
MQIYRNELNKREEVKQESTYMPNSREEVTQMAQAAAEKIQGVLGSFGASFMGSGPIGGAQEAPTEPPVKELNFSDDEDDWAKMKNEVVNKAPKP